MNDCNFSICCKKLSMDGQIIQNIDYGVGYTIVWQNKPITLDCSQRTGTTPQQLILVVMQQLKFLNNSKYYNEKYTEAESKLAQAIKILQK